MADADTKQSTTQCKALTEDGERCSRPAQDDGFCYQHDESDPTVSDSQTAEREPEQEDQEPDSSEADAGEERRSAAGDMTAEERTDPETVDTQDVDVDHAEIEGVLAVRRTVESTAGEVIGREFDGVSEIAPTDEGWRAVVEVVERRAVPDTQDIIGRYEIELDVNGTVHGYRRLDRYRRGDTVAFE
ncbi:gas vesicle protein GvpO, halophile-type [Halopiger djelfimassiliensis]|uniref:gas vesicle protein GvpO, halophile-type n=1 Tax=Halopiger djelfimassiliensis TaxID=1293047 RepID=UPI0006782738|nr:gas vesicle protein GvpO [Halopiger djelfimassiliensis]